MIKIAITPELIDESREYLHIRAILDAGWDRVHLRHPSASLSDIRRLIEAIPQHYHRKIVLHGHFELCNYFNLGGLHLNSRCPVAPKLYHGGLSKSCHSIEELKQAGNLTYVTLSPIFDSISKNGYIAAFSHDDLKRLDGIDTPVIALGGVTPQRIKTLEQYNFSGFAMLGSLPWSGSHSEMSRFAESIIKSY